MTTANAPTVLHAFLAALDAGDAERTASLFAEDAKWLRPLPAVGKPGADATHGATGDGVLRGRDEIRAYLEQRGQKPYRHKIINSLADDVTCFVEGVVTTDDMRSFFMCRATTRAGLIVRYTTAATAATDAAVAQIVDSAGD